MRDDVVLLGIDNLFEFTDQPFKVIDDDSMAELTESVKMVGVLVPIIVRKIEGNKYEIISGHRRKRACEIAGIKKIPAVITKLNDDEAAILLVDSNLHRENYWSKTLSISRKVKLQANKNILFREIKCHIMQIMWCIEPCKNYFGRMTSKAECLCFREMSADDNNI